MKNVLFIFVFALFFGNSPVFAKEPGLSTLEVYDDQQAYFPEKQWSVIADPKSMGWSKDRLAVAKKFSDSLQTSALMIIENGVVVGAWGDLKKRYRAHSMRKSFLSALYGKPVQDGEIDLSSTLGDLNIDDEPPLAPFEKVAMVSDLLKARSGVYHFANFETSSMRKKRPSRGSYDPGTHWYYNNWDFNALLTIYEKQTGEKIFEQFENQIAKPIGMEQFRLKDTSYYRGKYSIHPAYTFRMSALDLGRFGLLFLRNGKWKDQQIIPKDWVAESTQSYSRTGNSSLYAGYGYLWWVGNIGYQAVGKSGHRLIVMPKKNLVIVHRVDTDQKHRVGSRDISKLLAFILDAKIKD
ncbi:MAG: hypothetical protein COB59_02215 [Rhodospirillaceae bacterium]|nr:MAG: hypothetical protein COB59_02215 [Rhodospirillaceae bacterium]